MERTANVARTAFDLDHINRLRVPDLQIVSFNLQAGAASSKCYLPPDAPTAAPATGTDNFHFVPEKETIDITYEIDDKFAVATGGKIEFFTRFDETAMWTLDLSVLGPDWVSHGKHTIKWDGRTVKPTAAVAATQTASPYTHDLTAIAVDKTLHADFADGYMTLQHGPYKVRLTVSAAPSQQLPSVYSWTYFHILIKSYEFVIGDKETVPAVVVDDAQHKRDEAVRKQVVTDGGVPADTATDPRKVVLVSNVFKTNANQMNDDTGFTEYQNLWGKGPHIPIVAKIRLAASDDSEVKLDESDKGAVALGKAKFLWDWEDPDETTTQTGFPKNFIEAAIDYYKATTGPKGDNCHLDRGGKRAALSAAVDPIFPVEAGYPPAATLTNGKFPFKVEAAVTRKWAAMSQGWTSGKLKGCTGVVFQPSRMAGDDYVLQIYLAYDKSAKDTLALDVVAQPLKAATAIKQKTGKFQVWREVDIARYVRKLSTITDFSAQFPATKTDYKNAYLDLKDVTTADDKYLVAQHKNPLTASAVVDYNKLCEEALLARGGWIFSQHVVSDETADHLSIQAAFKFRLYEDMVKKAHFQLHFASLSGFNLIAIARAGNVTTATVGNGHGIKAGDWIYIQAVADATFNGTHKVTGATADGFTYANKGASGSSTGGAAFFNKDIRTRAVATYGGDEKTTAWKLGTDTLPLPTTTAFTIDMPPPVFRLANVATITTTDAHGFSTGDSFTIANVSDATFNGTFTVKDSKGSAIFTYANAGATAQSGGGDVKAERALTATITKVKRTATAITFTMSAAHGLVVGDKVKVSGVAQAGFNGDYTVTAKTADTFDVAFAGAALVVQAPLPSISKVKRAANVATFSMISDSGLAAGDKVTVSGISQAGFNGVFTVKSAAGLTFDVDNAGADVAERASVGAATKEVNEQAATGSVKKEVNLTIAAAKPAGASHVVTGTTAVSTFVTTADHGFAAGNDVVVRGVGESSMDGTYSIMAVPDTKSFTVSMGGDERISGGGAVQKSDDAMITRLAKTQTWLKDWKFHTLVQYSKNMNFRSPGTELVTKLALMAGGKTAAAKDGVTIIHFENVHSIVSEVQSASPAPSDMGDMIYLLGEAIDVADATRHRCAFVFYRTDVQTFVHEVGHHLFLPHAKYPLTGNTPGGYQVDRHDDDDPKCTMGYNHPTRSFCGLCQLRLRGWTALQLSKNDADNKKP